MSASTGGTSLGYSDVAKAKNAIQECIDSMDKEIKSIEDAIAMVSGSWQGQAAAMLKAKGTELHGDHREILSKLRILHEAVGETKNLSEANDLEVRAAFKGVSGIDNL